MNGAATPRNHSKICNQEKQARHQRNSTWQNAPIHLAAARKTSKTTALNSPLRTTYNDPSESKPKAASPQNLILFMLSGRTEVVEFCEATNGGGSRRRKRIFERKCLGRRPLLPEKLQPNLSLCCRGSMPFRYPPQHGVAFSHRFKPFLPAFHDFNVGRFVDVVVKSVDVPPNAEVHKAVVTEWAESRSVTVVGL